MKKVMKATMLIMGMLFVFSSSVNAETKSYAYDLDLNSSKTSAEATKAGGSSFEEKSSMLLRGDVSRPQDSTRYFSYHVRKNGKQVSNGLKLSEDDFDRHYNSYYSGKAIANTKYKLYCKLTGYGDNSFGAGVRGRWTP